MSYFVTGGTGLIGGHLVARLLRREGDVHLLVRRESREKLTALRAAHPERIHLIEGDLTANGLGVDKADLAVLTGSVDHFFHIAAVYDLTADDERNHELNVEGTRHALELAQRIKAGCFHHVSSVAVAGLYEGRFTEDMFAQGQRLPSAYHRTKYESEQLVRDTVTIPWRVYRPAIVVGDSRTGEMDKVDGPYYFLRTIQRAGRIPEWTPIVGPDLGETNIVPVDYVVDAMDHIAHQAEHNGATFHLASSEPQRSVDVFNTFATKAHAPQIHISIDPLLTALPLKAFDRVSRLPGLKQVRSRVLSDLGIPEEVLAHIGFSCRFDTANTQRALIGSGISCPDFEAYAGQLWDYWVANLAPKTAPAEQRPTSAVQAPQRREAPSSSKTVVITGASSGIGRAAAHQVAKAGGIPLLVARGKDQLDEVRREIEDNGGRAYVYPTDLTDMDAIEALGKLLVAEHPRIDVLVNNAGRSIRRSVKLSYDRFHDYERTMSLNYFGAVRLILALLPAMTEQGGGHIINVSSIGVQTNAPRFSAYVASKAALDAFSRVVASEVLGDGVRFTTIHMPLVRTPMIAPTKMYDAFPTITPDEAAEMISAAIRSQPKSVDTRLGKLGEVAYALAPTVVDRVMHRAYKVFPDSSAARGDGPDAKAAAPSREAMALTYLLRGVHW